MAEGPKACDYSKVCFVNKVGYAHTLRPCALHQRLVRQKEKERKGKNKEVPQKKKSSWWDDFNHIPFQSLRPIRYTFEEVIRN